MFMLGRFNIIFISFICTLSVSKLSGQSLMPDINIKKTLTGIVPGKPDVRQLYKSIFKPGISLSNASTEITGFISRSIVSEDYTVAQYMKQFNARNAISIDFNGIPFGVEYIKNISQPVFFTNTQNSWFKFSFDTEAYKEKMKKLAQKMGPEQLSSFHQELNALKSTFAQRMMDTYKNKAEGLLKHTLDSLSNQYNPMDLEGKTPRELAYKFFGQDVERLYEETNHKLKEKLNQNLEDAKKDSLIVSLEAKKRELEEKINYLNKIIDATKKAKESGMLDMMKNLQGKSKAEYEELLKNPSAIADKLSKSFNLGGFEKFLTLLSGFKLGGQSLPFADNFNMPMLGKGLSFDIDHGDRYLSFALGKTLPTFNFQQIMTGNLNSINGQLNGQNDRQSFWSVGFRKGHLIANHKGIKLTSISGFNNNGYQTIQTELSRKNTLLINIYSRERIFADNWLKFEVSKSIVKGPELVSERVGDLIVTKSKPDFFTLNNMSVKVGFEGTIPEAGITHDMYYRLQIGSYVNLAQNNASTSGYEAGFSVRMKQKNKKLSSYLKGQIRSFSLPGNEQSKWQNIDIKSRLSYQIKRGKSVQLNLMWHDGIRNYMFDNVSNLVKQQSKGASADFQLSNKRIFGLYNTSFISVGYQRDAFPSYNHTQPEKMFSNTINLLLNQTFMYHEHMLQMNVMYNQVSQNIDALLYNTKFDIDAGVNFKISEKLQAGAFLVYGYMKSAYTNFGVKPSISALISKKINVEASGDFRKNLTLSNPLFSQFTNMNCSVKYVLK